MKKVIISILVLVMIGGTYKLLNKSNIEFSKGLKLPSKLQSISFSEYPTPPQYIHPSIKNLDAEIFISNKFLKSIGDSLLKNPIIQPLKINNSKNDYLVIEKLNGIEMSDHNSILISLKCKFKISELFSRITMTATEVIVEAVPYVLSEANHPIFFNFSMTNLKINHLAPAIEKGLAHLATDALNKIEIETDLAEIANLDIEKPQSNEIISPSFQKFAFKVDKSGLTLLSTIDE